MTQESDYNDVLELYSLADDRTRTQLLSLNYFYLWRRSRSSLAQLESWQQHSRLDRLQLLITGAVIYHIVRKSVAITADSA